VGSSAAALDTHVAHDLRGHVLDGDQARHLAVLVDGDGQLGAAQPEVLESWMRVISSGTYLTGRMSVPGSREGSEQVLGVDHPEMLSTVAS